MIVCVCERVCVPRPYLTRKRRCNMTHRNGNDTLQFGSSCRVVVAGMEVHFKPWSGVPGLDSGSLGSGWTPVHLCGFEQLLHPSDEFMCLEEMACPPSSAPSQGRRLSTKEHAAGQRICMFGGRGGGGAWRASRRLGALGECEARGFQMLFSLL